jgi:hypothetical protein
VAVAAACVIVSVSFRLIDTDFWQHLLVGKATWQLHAFPTRQLWTWPLYGTPDVNASWGFRALIWPIWSAAGIAGLTAWRWITTLLAFGLLWAAARRMGARGLTPLVVLVLCSLAYRQRAQIRPETLVAVLMALELWILEALRARAPGTPMPRSHVVALVLVAWAWANAHISYTFFFVILLAYALALRRPRRRNAPLGRVALAALAVSFVNPFGWRALAQPFQYLLFWRHEPIYRLIEELQPIQWSLNVRNLLPLLFVLWPVLMLWRWRRRGLDPVEAVLCAGFTAMALNASRFIGFHALAAAPFLSRDLDEWARARRWPAWTAKPWPHAVATMVACAGIGIAEWSRPDPRLGLGIEERRFPVAACDFIAAHGIRGHGFNKFELGGYQAWRFWPDTTRLPFMDIHQSGTREDRDLYARALGDPAAWHELDRRHRFDYALLDRPQSSLDRITDALDADTSWALVLWDDPSRLYVRRNGALRDVAARFGCAILPGGLERLGPVFDAALRDSATGARLERDLEQQARRSPFHASAKSLLASLAMARGRLEDARRLLIEALRADPSVPQAHERLAAIDDSLRARDARGR